MKLCLSRAIRRAAAVLVCVAVLVKINGRAIPENTAASIKLGMSKAEVMEIAGEPHRQRPGIWLYRVWNGPVTYSDMLGVKFDENDRVTWVSF